MTEWFVAKRVDWPEAKRPYIIVGGADGIMRSTRGVPCFFKTQESAQRWADQVNAEEDVA